MIERKTHGFILGLLMSIQYFIVTKRIFIDRKLKKSEVGRVKGEWVKALQSELECSRFNPHQVVQTGPRDPALLRSSQ